MRPIRIEIAGFRSFREEGEIIEWNDEALVAIIGDTGAGKSSILEAMTFALYGQTSIAGQQLRDLINDDASRLRVMLRFWGPDGYTWEAGRETARRTTDREAGPQTAWLRQYGDRSEVLEAADGVRAVNERVARLLGLDHRAFLRTMVLPQGRFAALLASDDQRGRSETLRQIWRSSELDEAGAAIAAARRRASECCSRLETERRREVEDPDAETGRLAEARTTSESVAGAARRRSERADTLTTRIDQHAARSERCRETATRLERVLASNLAHARTAARAAGDASAAEKDYSDRAAAIEAQAPKRGSETAAEAERRLAEIDRRLDAVERLRDAAENERASEDAAGNAERRLAHASGTAATARTELENARARRDATQERSEEADRAAETADTAANAAQAEWNDQRTAWILPLSEAQEARKSAAAEATRTSDAQETAEETAAKAAAEAATARAALEEAASRSHAHAAARTLTPGEPCSVCGQQLPADWRIPDTPEELDGLRSRSEQAETRKTRTRAEAARRGGAAEAAHSALERIEGRIRELEQKREDHGISTTAMQAQVDETVRRSKAARRTAAAARDTAAQARIEHEAAGDRHASAEATRREAETDHRHKRAQAGKAAQACATAYDALEAEDRPASRHPDGAAIDPITVRLSVQRAETAEALARATEDDDRAAEAGRLREKAGQQHAARREAESQMRNACALMAAAVDGQLAPAAGIVEDGHEDLERLVAETAAALEQRAAAERESEAEADRQRREAERALEAEGTAMGMALPVGNAVRQTAAEEAARATAAAETARRAERDFAQRRKLIAELDRRIEEATALRERLAEAERALKPGGFPKWLTLRRSRTLLQHANAHLERLSHGRYGFVDPERTREQWMLRDERSGALRQPSSLSGGEQFLAALALSLGMVETIGRKGGRLESFFLDEGFGTLDPEALDTAVAALESAARPDHLVGVITHVREVAERMPHVLAVRNTQLEGTRAEWLDETAQAQVAGKTR